MPAYSSPPGEPLVIYKLNRIAAEMVELSARCEILGTDYERARELGRRAYWLWGEPGMLYCFGVMSLAYGQGLISPASPEQTFHPQDFYAAWDGIGPWRG